MNRTTRPGSRNRARAALMMIAAMACLVRTGEAQMIPARQVTVFGVLATPGGGAADPKLASVLPQLRRLLPHHGFKLIKIESQRAVAGQSVVCDLGDGFLATCQLVEPRDLNGKVQMRFHLTRHDESQFQTVVSTPPDQVMFCEKMLPDGSRLLIGLGAR